MEKKTEINQDRVITNQLSGMSLEEAVFQDGFSSGYDSGYERGKREKGAVWLTGHYDELYDQVKGGKKTVCWVWKGDWWYVCGCYPETLEFNSRSHSYGYPSKFDKTKDEKQLFIALCESLQVNWLYESVKQPVRLTQDRADLIREANNRDMGGIGGIPRLDQPLLSDEEFKAWEEGEKEVKP